MIYYIDPRVIGFVVLYIGAVVGLSTIFHFNAVEIIAASFLLLIAILLISSTVFAILQIISWITGKDFGLDD